MPNTLANVVEQYIAALRATHSLGAHVPETSFYTPLKNLCDAAGAELSPRVLFVSHPSIPGVGSIPDGGLFALPGSSRSRRVTEPLPGQRPERGVVEIKPPGISLDALQHTPQVTGYLRQFGLCLITNYHQFRLLAWQYNAPQTLEHYDLTLTADALWSENLTELAKKHAQTLPDFLQRVMTRQVPLERPKDVAWLLASYAREAKASAEQHPLAAFEGVKEALQQSLGITFEGEKGLHFFLSTLIQTLFYGIFSAWILWRRTPEGRAYIAATSTAGVTGQPFNWRLSADYLRIPVLRELFHAISERGALDSVHIMQILDRAGEALNRIQPGFFATFNEEDAVNYFYEPFLEAFDPELRKQLGVWYTPREIVRYMVERVDHLLRTELNEPLGLASPNVQVLDPCCGTGAYLVEVLHRIERTLREQAGDDDAFVADDLRRAATTRIFGFEIMPAPFVIAHLQVANLLERSGASLAAAQRAQVFLTNALTGWVPIKHPQSNFGYTAIAAERDAAEAVKQADTILVILGNPPYNGYSGIAKIEEERDLTTAYRTQVPGLNAPQGQGLNDLYVRFFRIAERRIVGDKDVRGNANGRGLVCFISNNAWLDGLSHVSMRARYLREFQSIYIDNLNGDKYRTGKTTPDGKPDPSAFSTPQNREGIQVGTAITTLVRRNAPKQTTPDNIPPHTLSFRSAAKESAVSPLHLRDIWGTHKLSHLDKEAKRDSEPDYQSIVPEQTLGVPFARRSQNDAFASWPRLPDILESAIPGIKTSRDSLLIDIDKSNLEKRMRSYLGNDNSESASKRSETSLKSTSRFLAESVRDELRTRSVRRYQGVITPEIEAQLRSYAYRPWQVRRYTYRPFDLRWIYWEPETKLLDEKRTEALMQSFPGNFLLEARQRESTDSFCRGSVTSALPDNFGAGLSTFFPMYHLMVVRRPLQMGRTESKEQFIPNQTLEALNYIFRLYRLRSTNSAEHTYLFLHALATMHTPRYRTENAGALLGNWPRIPLPATAELLTHSAILGRRLAELLDPESDIQLQAEWSFLARLSLPPEFPEDTPGRENRNAERFALTAGWGGPGKGATVMPRRGDARERDWTETELARLTTLAATQSLPLDEALSLLGPRCVDVYLNGDAYWAAVPAKVWEYTLGGYQVLKKWLSYREQPLLGRPLHPEEARYFAQVARRIAAILLMGPALDASYAAILPTATGLPTN